MGLKGAIIALLTPEMSGLAPVSVARNAAPGALPVDELRALRAQVGAMQADFEAFEAYKMQHQQAHKVMNGKLGQLLGEWEDKVEAAQAEGLQQGIKAAEDSGVLGQALDAKIEQDLAAKLPENVRGYLPLVKGYIPLLRATAVAAATEQIKAEAEKARAAAAAQAAQPAPAPAPAAGPPAPAAPAPGSPAPA